MSNGYYYVAEVQDNFIATLHKITVFLLTCSMFFSLKFLNTWESFVPIVWSNVTPTLCREIVNWIYLTKSVNIEEKRNVCHRGVWGGRVSQHFPMF